MNNVKALVYGPNDRLYNIIYKLFEHESIDVIFSSSAEECKNYFSNGNVYIFIVDCCTEEIINSVMFSKLEDIFRPIIAFEEEDSGIKKQLYQMGVNLICNYNIDEDDLFSQTLNLITLYQAKKNSKSQNSVLKTLSLALEVRDFYTHGHGERLAIFTTILYDELGFKDFEEKEALRAAAIIHDVGKIGTPDDILKSKNKLSKEDFEIIKKHPEDGVKICLKIISDSRVIDIIQHHHEKLDGSGYPHNLKSNEINHLIQIITICDIYDALTSDRSYRVRNTQEEAIKIMDEEFNNKLNQEYYIKFKELLKLNKFIGLKYI